MIDVYDVMWNDICILFYFIMFICFCDVEKDMLDFD